MFAVFPRICHAARPGGFHLLGVWRETVARLSLPGAGAKTQTMKFTRALRMNRSGEFRAVREGGNSLAGRLLVLAFRTDPEVPAFRSGLITSKRVGNAVVRNRVRRRLRSIIREAGPRIHEGVCVVTIARPRAANAPFRKLRNEWFWLARRAKILTEDPKNARGVRRRGNQPEGDPRFRTA